MKKRKSIGILCLLASLVVVNYSTAEAKPQADTYGEYKAAMGLATEAETVIYRTPNYAKEELSNQLVAGKEGKAGYQIFEGSFQDAQIKGNGTYTVLLKQGDFSDGNKLKKLYIATNIPNTGEIKFSNLTVSFNGRVLRTYEKPVIASKKSYCTLLVLDQNNKKTQDEFLKNALQKRKNNVIKLQFKVSGFSYKKGEEPVRPTPTAEPVATPVNTPDTVEASVSPKPEKEVKEEKELPIERKVGIAVVVVLAIGGIVATIIVVNQKQR